MKKIITFITILLFACKEDDKQPQVATNNIEVIKLGQLDNGLAAAVDVFYAIAEQNEITPEKGLTIKTFSSPEAGDQTRINGKVIEIDREFITHLTMYQDHIVSIYVAKQIGKVLYPNNLECVNKIDFSNTDQLVNSVYGKSQDFIASILLPNYHNCPI
jgi:hypothetical protein